MTMNKTDIERILGLQHGAYELLLWLNKRAENEQALLCDENLEKWRYAESCEVWVRDMYGMIPRDLRPAESDIAAFSRLFSSFFRTSFRVVDNATVSDGGSYGDDYYYQSGQRRLMASAPDGKRSSKGNARVRETADELRVIALEELALENELFPLREALEAVANDSTLSESLTVWTYFHELARRANFASQGVAVRSLWQAMDKNKRKNLSADNILAARDPLVLALKRVS